MILVALVPFVLTPPPSIQPWEFYGTLLCLSAMLALNATADRITALVSDPGHGEWLTLLLNTVLFLGAFMMGASGLSSFIPFLGFMLVGQATFSFPLKTALGYSGGLMVVIGVITLITSSASTASVTLLSMLPGVFFTMVFTLLARRAGQQTERVEALLVDLQRANAELAAAQVRERELAASEERVRLAREIHDGLGHHLTVLTIQLQAAEKLAPRDPVRAAQAVSTARQVAQAALHEVRHSVAALRQSPLDGRTLEQALSALVADFDHAAPLNASFTQHGAARPLAPAVALTLYRTAQEGLTNAQKYTAGARVAVELTYTPTHVGVTVADDGRPLSTTPVGGGFGLLGLRERAEQLGGTFSAAATATGFVLTVIVPSEEGAT
jgi:signal transduction histidine kinase